MVFFIQPVPSIEGCRGAASAQWPRWTSPSKPRSAGCSATEIDLRKLRRTRKWVSFARPNQFAALVKNAKMGKGMYLKKYHPNDWTNFNVYVDMGRLMCDTLAFCGRVGSSPGPPTAFSCSYRCNDETMWDPKSCQLGNQSHTIGKPTQHQISVILPETRCIRWLPSAAFEKATPLHAKNPEAISETGVFQNKRGGPDGPEAQLSLDLRSPFFGWHPARWEGRSFQPASLQRWDR